MSSILGEIGLTEQLVLSYIIGLAGAPAVRPYTQSLVNDAWRTHPVLPVNAQIAALGVAQGQIDPTLAKEWAQEQGLGAGQFQAMVDAANTGPALGYAYQAWRRGQLSDGQFQTALIRQAIEPQWFAALEDLKHDRLDLGAISTAVHRGIMQDAGLLVTPVPSGSGNVPRIPVSSLDTLAEFAAQGIDPERARVLVADTGLPLPLGEMLQLFNRGQVTATDVKVSIAESNVRNEYMDVALDLARRLLTPHEYAEAELRGVKTRTEAENGAALSGLNTADYVTLFEIMGRPLNVHEITTGLARGGTFGGDYSTIPEPYQDAIRRSAIRPEYAHLAYANRYSYPSAFVLRSLAQAGDLGGQAQVAQVLEEIGWKPSFAKQVSTAWTGGATSGDPHEAKAQTQLWTTTHRSYVAEEIDDAVATAALGKAGVAAAAIPAILALWAEERSLVRKQLSPTQIRKALNLGLVNPATGVAWTQADAEAAMLARGYDQADATVFLQE